MSEKPEKKVSFEDNALFHEVMKEALAIQDRFAAEPIYAKTGKGYLKSAGVEEIAQAKKSHKKTGE